MSAMRSDLYESVQQAISDASPPPGNETETCDRIIYPLLLAAGYSRKEIKSQDRDAANQKPDYTLLPELADYTWFLEAKGWSISLSDAHAAQAVNYANTQGKRWVVLTNGKEWRLYDNDIRESAEKKLAVRVGLREESFVSFLEAISRQSITEGKLEDFVLNQRLYSALAIQISKPDSDVVKAIRRVLRGLPGLGQASGARIVGYFQSETAAEPVADVQPEQNTSSQAGAARTPSSGDVCVKGAKATEVTGRKPVSLLLPDGHVIQGGQWKAISTGLAKYLCERGLITDFPLFIGPRSKCPCLALTGSTGTERMREPVEFSAGRKTYLVETHYSAIGHIRNWSLFLTKAGWSDADCHLKLSN